MTTTVLDGRAPRTRAAHIGPSAHGLAHWVTLRLPAADAAVPKKGNRHCRYGALAPWRVTSTCKLADRQRPVCCVPCADDTAAAGAGRCASARVRA